MHRLCDILVMKHPALLISVIMTIVLVSCSPTTETLDFSQKENINPSSTLTPTPTSNEKIEESDTEPAETQIELMSTPLEEDASTMTPDNFDDPKPTELPQVNMAKEDLATRLNISEDKIEIFKVEFVTWPNSAMGCPQPGMVYKQVPQDGLLIQLSVDDVTYSYHSGGTQAPFLCQPSPTEKSTPPKLDLEDLITPPANSIDE